MNIDAARRALDRAESRLDQARSERQRETALAEVDRCRDRVERAEAKMARDLEAGGTYEVTPRRRRR